MEKYYDFCITSSFSYLHISTHKGLFAGTQRPFIFQYAICLKLNSIIQSYSEIKHFIDYTTDVMDKARAIHIRYVVIYQLLAIILGIYKYLQCQGTF